MSATAPHTTAHAAPPGIRIAGTGVGIPDQLLTNADLEKLVDTSDEWITQRTGIKQRHVVKPGDRNADLGARAVRGALDAAGLPPAQLDLLICATMTPDVICPAMSCEIVKKIGAIPAGAFDINIACTGFVAALNLAANCIRSGFYRNVAVVASETLTRITNYEDRGTCVLFGDAASAAVLVPSDDPRQGCLFQSLGSDGQRGEVLYVPRTAADIPASEQDTFTGKYNTLQMNGRAVYKFAVEKLAECVERAMAQCHVTAADVKMIIPHQSNTRMLESAWKRLGIGDDKIYINIDRYGNTSAASVGICLHELFQQKKIGRGDYVVFVAQGGGLSWGTSLWRL